MNNNTTATTAEAYYTAMKAKDLASMEKYLHPEVHLFGPLDDTHGKEVVVEAIKKFFPAFKALTIRAVMGSENQAVVIMDIDFPEQTEKLRVASFVSFRENLISDIELFFDARCA